MTLHAPGLHNVRNALAAAAAALAAGASLDAVARGLAAFRPVNGRLQPKPGRNGVLVIDDTYNANPDSVRAAIDVLAASERPRVLVLGDMGEVGAQGLVFHEEVGRYAKEAGIDRLIAVGTLRAHGRARVRRGRRAPRLDRGGDRARAGPHRAQGDDPGEGLALHAHGASGRAPARREGRTMLLEIAQYLSQDVRAFNVFSYISLRAVLAALTALVISFLAGPAMIRKLATYKIGQSVRDDGPQTHLTKAGTPTMGGALILVSIAVTTILWADWSNRFVWIVLAVTLGFGAVGWVDDYRKVVHRNPKGLSAREKYFWQSLIGLAAAVSLAFAVPASSAGQAWSLFTQWVTSGS